MPKSKSHCPACTGKDTKEMVSCCHCGTWWHFKCVGVNASIANDDRTFNCPQCQKPSSWIPLDATPSPSEKGSKAGSEAAKSTSSSRSKRTQLKLAHLEAMKELAMRQLEVERREQEQQNERRRLQVEAEVLEATFRIQQSELGDDDDDRSVVTVQSSRSKVEQWQRQLQQYDAVNSTMIPTTSSAGEQSASRTTTAAGDQPGQGGKQTPPGADSGLLTGTVHVTGSGQTLGGILNRTSSVITPAGNQNQLVVQQNLPSPIVPLQVLPTIPEDNGKLAPPPPIPTVLGNTGSHGQSLLRYSGSMPLLQSLVHGANSTQSGGSGTATVPLGNSSTSGLMLTGQQQPGCPVFPPAPIPQVSIPQVMPTGQQQPGCPVLPPAPIPQVPIPPAPMPQVPIPPAPIPQAPIMAQQLSAPMLAPGTQQLQYPPAQVQQSMSRNLVVGQPPWVGPTQLQVQSRHVMPKDLPTFTGKPEEWPVFISAYNNSTQACGYSNVENLSRLQKCLKGDALTHVQSLLLIPEGVPHVLAQLEQLYGRPELLIHTLLRKIRDASSPKEGDPDSLVSFGLMVQNLCNYVVAAGQQPHLNNPELLMSLVGKLPANWMMDWSLYQERCANVNLQTFSEYMQVLVRAGMNASLYRQMSPSQQPSAQRSKEKAVKSKSFCGAHSTEDSPKTPGKVEALSGTSRPSGPACYVCKHPKHRVKDCREFAKFDVKERWETVQQFGLCRTCLGVHGKRPCQTRKLCEVDGCQLKHHALLHEATQSTSRPEEKSGKRTSKQDAKPAEKETKQQPTDKASGTSAVTNHHSAGKMALFRILPVTLYGNNRSVAAYAFLDDGSSRTLIEEDLVKQLGVVGEVQPLCLQWTANMKRTESASQRVALDVSGRSSGTRYKLGDVRTVAKLDLPRQSLRFAEMAAAYPYLRGLPVDDYEEAVPCILIGNDNAHVTSTLKMRDGRPGEPIAAKTRLGWSVYGSNQDSTVERSHSFHICECQDDGSLHELVEKFFAVESLGVMEVTSPESAEIQRANRILAETTKRVGRRFEAGLLWKFDHFEFPDSFPMAFRRLLCLERRIQSDPVIGESVRRQMKEYQEKSYIHKATAEELAEADPRRVWYLPLGVALNPKKPGKVRIFCDAAAKVDGVSLNTMLLKGPDLLIALLVVLFGFREKRVALCADLQEMFHQVRIRREDRHAQRLLWREDPAQAPEVYLMDVATFGATCSPCIAQHVMKRNAEEHAEEFPAAANAIIKKHYMDDYLDSADDVEEAVRIALDVKSVHAAGGFHLRNWLSNSREVLARVGETDSPLEKCLQLDKSESTERVLGMYWRPEPDIFTFSTKLATDVEHPTKRDALRVVMSPFDPAGLLCYFLVHGKILIQEMWRAKIDWDERIPQKLCERWVRWTEMFRFLDQISIPRCYFAAHSMEDVLSLQLHVFADASEEAYACVAYLRAEFPEEVEVALVAGKSKVAPLKAHSIPRLELMAAVIGVRLSITIVNGHSFKFDKVVFWSDSKTVLAWIQSDHRLYRQFVACRVGEILLKSKMEQWRWVPTKENVADDATKWGKGPCLSSTGRWFRGPEFLRYPEEQWPVAAKAVEDTTEEELRPCMVHQETKPRFIEWDHFSKWSRLCRATAYVHRFVSLVRQRGSKRTKEELETVQAAMKKGQWDKLRFEPLQQEELAAAENTVFRWTQREVYAEEVSLLEEAQDTQPGRQVQLGRNSPIRKTSPYLDEYGVIRSDGRIAAAPCISLSTKYPIVMPKDHRVTLLLCEQYHRQQLHANKETVVNEMRQRFHVSALRQLVRNVAKQCRWCKVHKPKLTVPREAPLPNDRLQAHVRPFTYTGVDYFGPIEVRVNRSRAKRWVALFTCMTVRAVHLEVVHSLSTESCKMAIRRFIAARGAPAVLRSDRGTNFVGANNELRKEVDNINQQLAETFTNANTRWVFNPPGSPHMGGSWERLVRSVKTALGAMHSPRTPNDETLATLIKEAESVVNSRPLTYMPLETESDEALTPNHFLLLSSSGVVQPPKALTDLKEACRSDWVNCQVLIGQFWRRWIREYLPTIARRTKWFEEVKPIGVGDLVIVVEDKERNGWYRGRVSKVIVGKDGRIRAAEVQTAAKGVVLRPVAKLALLDVSGGEAGVEA